MTLEEITALMDRFERGGCTALRLSMQDVSLELEKAPAASGEAVPGNAAPAPAAPADGSQALTAPLVGTYYAAPAPGEPPFVQAGDRVEKGRTVCLLEAMKAMNEVPAPCDLVVTELCLEDGALVEFGAPILRYRPCSGGC